MYCSDHFKQVDDETFTLRIPKDEDFRILQLTDLHLGFGPLSRRMDRLALEAVRTIIERSKPHLIVLTGDSIFPFLPRAGTLNNRKQAQKLMEFLDGFEIPYTLVLAIMIVKCSQLAVKKNWLAYTSRGATASLRRAGMT